MSYLIDDVLPSNRINLLGGVSDAGKTRFIIPAMLDWEQGLPVLGKASHPVPWAYVAADRPLSDVHDSLTSMGYSTNTIRIIPAFGLNNKNWFNIMRAAIAMQPRPELLVWESFTDMPDGERRSEIKSFLGTLGAFCEGCPEWPNGLTILGIVESPKQKPHDKYPNPRQRISGSSAWAYHTSTVMLLEGLHSDEALELPERTLWVCMKNAQRRKLLAKFDAHGRLLVP